MWVLKLQLTSARHRDSQMLVLTRRHWQFHPTILESDCMNTFKILKSEIFYDDDNLNKEPHRDTKTASLLYVPPK